jgi:EAL domain-containing protein (putative c-di-GMP-specific phosphodiesterase class I)
MASSATPTTPRFVLRAQRWPILEGNVAEGNVAAGIRRRYPEPATEAFCSSAGLHLRPWLGRLRRALRDGLFELHYQPIVALKCGTISHHEALLRLADEPGGRLIAPGAFLPAAERYGLVGRIDRLVVERVAALLGGERVDRSRNLQRVAINLSALSVTDAGMLAHIERELARHGVDPARLIVEITETAAISDMRRATAFCEGVQALGCAVALDDFGVGFGSLYYAKRLPFDYLKIDGDFVRGLCAGAHDRVMVRAIVEVARGMGRETIAEFVGDEPTMRLLGELGVDYAQGFHVGRPQ